jgi:YD repeat protein
MASPNDAASIKSIQSNMNYYDGTMNIQIPLYTLSEFGMTVPVLLRYKTSGIKVEDTASSVGLGWDLSTGYKITRIVQRKPDEKETKGFCNGTYRTPKEVFHTFFNDWSKGKDWDHASDLYYFEIPSHSGLFVCDISGKVHTIPYQGIDITWVNKTYFRIKDTQGNEYIFGDSYGARETSISKVKGGEQIEYTSTWLLSRIENQFGNQILFFYQNGDSYTIENTRERYTFNTDSYNGGVPTPRNYITTDESLSTTIKDPKYIRRIQGRTAALEFHTGLQSNRTRAMKYNRIDICSGIETSIRFDYSNFQNGELRLDAIYRYDAGGHEKEKIAGFQYCTSPNLPARNSKDFDHWGYYNGKRNDKLFPAFEARRGQLQIYGGADRSSDLYYAQANTLIQIDYGTGGYEAYSYELNTVAGSSPMGGLRIKTIRQSDGRKAYTTSLHYQQFNSTISSGIKLGLDPIYCFSKANAYENVVFSHRKDYSFNFLSAPVEYSSVQETLPNGSYNIYDYTTSNDPGGEDERGVCYRYTYMNEFIEVPDAAVEGLILKTSNFWRRGLLTKARHYDADNNLISNTENTYQFGASKAIIQSYIPEPTAELGSFLHSYFWKSEPIYLVKTETEAGPYNTRSEVLYEYDTTYMVPKVIRAIDGMGNETIKRISYPFDFTGNASSPYTHPNIYALDLLKERKIVVPIETVVSKNGRVVQGEYTRYKISIGKKANYDKYVPVPAYKYILALQNPIAEKDFTYFRAYDLTTVADSRYRLQQYFDHYNSNGQLLTYRTMDDARKAVIYGYNETLPIAEIDNATASVPLDGQYSRTNQVFYTGFEDTPNSGAISYIPAKAGGWVYAAPYQIDLRNFSTGTYLLSYWKSTDSGETWTKVTENVQVTSSSTSHTIGGNCYIDEVRMMPRDAFMTTYTWLPGVGKTIETDANGKSIYYEYDEFGRQVRILDNDKNPVKSYEYHMGNQ